MDRAVISNVVQQPWAGRDSQAEFDALQAKLVPLWQTIRTSNDSEQTIVVVPSADVDLPLNATAMQAYEERYLFLLLLLAQPRARMVYVTGQEIHPSIVDYYLGLLPGVIASHARRRLHLVSPMEASPRSLTRKLLDRPRLIERIRSLIPDPDRAHLVPFITHWDDRQLALRLGIPMYGADPRHLPLGTKSGSRRIFVEEKVAHPLGRQYLHSFDDLQQAVIDMRSARPSLRRVVVKLNEGLGGMSNADVDLSGLPATGSAAEKEEVAARLRSMRFEVERFSFDTFVEQVVAEGAVIEERIDGDELRSPSVQLRITPLGELELLSTHDQLLGGPTGQTFLGSRFPADPAYSRLITREAEKVGGRLAKEGVIGRFAVDFVVSRNEAGWQAYAIEINLRKGGTTHPFLTLQFLTGGSYVPASGAFIAPNGRPKYYVSSDHVESERYRVFDPESLFDLAMIHRLHFNHSLQTGAVFHMMSALPLMGKVGVTAVGDSPEEADAFYRKVVEAMDDEA